MLDCKIIYILLITEKHNGDPSPKIIRQFTVIFPDFRRPLLALRLPHSLDMTAAPCHHTWAVPDLSLPRSRLWIFMSSSREVAVRFTASARYLSLLQSILTSCGSHPAICPSIQWIAVALPSGGKRSVWDIDTSPPKRTKTNNAWSCTSTPPYLV